MKPIIDAIMFPSSILMFFLSALMVTGSIYYTNLHKLNYEFVSPHLIVKNISKSECYAIQDKLNKVVDFSVCKASDKVSK